jgi:glycosyltransferase involved in cell wall biosynthesis
MMTELSIIIPTLNEEQYLPRLLESIATQSYTGKLQIIVVDGHSEDNTLQCARSFADKIVDLRVITAKRGIGHQKNVGAARAKNEFLLFIDADVILPPLALEQLARKTRPEASFVATVMHTSEDVTLADRVFLSLVYVLLFVAWIGRVPVTNGDFMLTTKTNHRRISGFVEGALLGEDTDYGVRSVRAGAKYHFYFKPAIIGSPRRIRDMGRLRLLVLWSRVFLHVRKHGPVFPGSGIEYPFGHYNNASKR